jgi:transposase
MSTDENRPRYNRDKRRYPRDLTDQEWSEVTGLIRPAKRGGRRRDSDVREGLNGIIYVLRTGCQWRYVSRDLPPRSTLHGYLQRWDHDGTLAKIRYALCQKCREQVDREPSPTACVIDRQSMKSAENGRPASVPKGMMQRRKSVARSGISGSIPPVC